MHVALKSDTWRRSVSRDVKQEEGSVFCNGTNVTIVVLRKESLFSWGTINSFWDTRHNEIIKRPPSSEATGKIKRNGRKYTE